MGEEIRSSIVASQAALSTIAASINKAHSECMAADGDIRDVILGKINKARECGEFLLDAKERIGHGKWLNWVTANLAFSEDTAARYMRFAKANTAPVRNLEEGVKSLKDAMIASGALPAKTHESQNLHANESNFFISAGKQLMAFGSLWDKQEKHHPVSQWAQETAEAFVAQMEPVIEKVNTIYAQAKERALSKAA